MSITTRPLLAPLSLLRRLNLARRPTLRVSAPASAPVPAPAPAPSPTAASNAGRIADRTLITQLLSHFKQTSEVRQYLRHYGRVDSDRFAVVKLAGDALASEAETAVVAASLAFLHRIGLVPIVVHGAGLFTGRRPAPVRLAADAVAEAGVVANTDADKGDRAGTVETDTAAVESEAGTVVRVAAEHMTQANARLVEALRREGVEAQPFLGSVFEAARDANYEGDLAPVSVGRITAVDVDAITSAVQARRIPIVAALGRSGGAGGELFTFPTQDAALALAEVVQPLKVIWLRPVGGLRTEAGAVVRAIDLCRDAPHLVRDMAAEYDGSQGGSAEKFDSGSGAEELDEPAARRAEACVEDLNLLPSDASCLAELAAFHDVLREPGATVSVTAPEFLAQELFTHRGEGSLITRGERVFAHSTLATIDVPRLHALLSAAFGAPLPAGYLERLAAAGRLKRVYVTEEYRGAAVVLHADRLPAAISYLDKFAVDPSAQGDKLGEVLWKAMVQRERKLFWRSRSANRVNAWYFEQSDGAYKADARDADARDGAASGAWTVFWRALDDGEVMAAVEQALTMPPTFPPRKVEDVDVSSRPPGLPTLK